MVELGLGLGSGVKGNRVRNNKITSRNEISTLWVVISKVNPIRITVKGLHHTRYLHVFVLKTQKNRQTKTETKRTTNCEMVNGKVKLIGNLKRKRKRKGKKTKNRKERKRNGNG